LFPGLDALVDQSLADALSDLPLAPPLQDALLRGEGVLGEALRCALAYEQGEWSNLSFGDLTAPDIGALYEETVTWVSEAMSFA